MSELFMPFSRGTRACIGINLVNMELKIVTAALLKRYCVRLADGMRNDDMEMHHHFLVFSKAGNENYVVFSRIGNRIFIPLT
jgi:cytochrome P450